MNTQYLQLMNVSKCFGNTLALNNLSLSISKGEIYSLVGPNGAGKTTTIKLVAGIYAPDSGTITVRLKDIQKHPLEVKASIGYIPDDPFVHEHITCRELLHFTGILHTIPSHTRKKRIERLSSQFSLTDVLDQPFQSCSRGNKQKISILAALIHKPSLLLIDEPIVGLDPHSASIAQSIFTDFAKKGGSILISTHTLSFIEHISDTIGFLHHGKIIQQGSMEQLRQEAHLKRASLDGLYKKILSQS